MEYTQTSSGAWAVRALLFQQGLWGDKTEWDDLQRPLLCDHYRVKYKINFLHHRHDLGQSKQSPWCCKTTPGDSRLWTVKRTSTLQSEGEPSFRSIPWVAPARLLSLASHFLPHKSASTHLSPTFLNTVCCEASDLGHDASSSRRRLPISCLHLSAFEASFSLKFLPPSPERDHARWKLPLNKPELFTTEISHRGYLFLPPLSSEKLKT